MEDIMMTFNKGLEKYLTKAEIKEQAPVVFADVPTNPKVSDKYLHANTEVIIDDLAKLNWFPVSATMRKSKGGDTIFSKHMLSFQNPDIMIKGKDGDDAYPRILLTNSHDGLNAFSFRVGVYRMACSNGLVIATEEFSAFKIKHMGYSFAELRNVVTQAVTDLPAKVEILNQMRSTILTQDQKNALAIDAMLIRAGIKPTDEQPEFDDETIVDILDPIRSADKDSDDLWITLNIIQEKITKGGYSQALKGSKVRKVRAIKSFEKDLDVNQKLFKKAMEYIEA
jgi:hypothetical protein